ncbi:MAG TPA: hypothetical protein DIT01_15760 [Lentisphaeria bacterium]|nr:hypothetical protein [Lentisphaeria bacterium]|tara:strand:- start:2546 stop:3472 length:927 start_codon:yes stop_codon:yes gene_type:complete
MALPYVNDAVNTRRRLATARRSLVLVLTVALVTATGCGIIRRSLVSSGTDTMAHLLTSVQAQPDPELVRQGLPAFILLLDGLIEAYPENPELLRAAATSYVAYAQAFLADPKDEERAARLYDRAHHYGMRLLQRHKHLAATLRSSGDSFELALRTCSAEDVPDLYVAGTAWLGWIIAKPDSIEALADLPRALDLMERILELDEGYGNGSAHLTFGIYYAIQPAGAGQDLAKSRHHFKRAIELGGGNDLTARLLYAEFIGKATLDRDFFSGQLEDILKFDVTIAPDHRLANELALQRARMLLLNQDDYF